MQIMIAILVLGAIGAIGAVALNRLAHRFHVDEDERVDRVESLLPGANCGGCGRKGCRDFASACVGRVAGAGSDGRRGAVSLDGLYCPVAGADTMSQIASMLGAEASGAHTLVATVRCAGTHHTKSPLEATYRGPRKCAVMAMTAGDYACLESCLGCGDCVEACPFGAISIPDGAETPVVDTSRCVGCGKCVVSCPRHIIELRGSGPRGRRVWVACSNCAKGVLTRRQCSVGCIGCGICARTCPFDAIEIKDNLAHIDYSKCRTCGKCVPVCPSAAIQSANITILPKE